MKAIAKTIFMKCNRCGNVDQNLFAKTNCNVCKQCFYCRKCLWVGKINGCQDLKANPLVFLNEKPKLKLEYQLSNLQKQASNFVMSCVGKKQDALLVAVCGAGKTEIIYQSINEMIKQKKKVCIAIPRVDVVRELKQRLVNDFKVKVSAFYGGSVDGTEATFFIMTVHQLFKYPRLFDLVVLDEADAFPYSKDRTLQYAVKNSVNKDGSIIYMTATPSLKLSMGIKNKFYVDSRYHNHRLDIPIFKKENFQNECINEIVEGDEIYFIFVPTIKRLREFEKIYKLPYVGFVSSSSDERESTINSFRNGELRVLFTTTVLERGVTFEGLNVCVINPNHQVYTVSTLVQICGRVGRKIETPNGKILFIVNKKTVKLIFCLFVIISKNIKSKWRGDIE